MLSVSSSPPPYPEAHEFLLVEGSCRIFAASESALNALRWRAVYAPSWGGPATVCTFFSRTAVLTFLFVILLLLLASLSVKLDYKYL